MLLYRGSVGARHTRQLAVKGAWLLIWHWKAGKTNQIKADRQGPSVLPGCLAASKQACLWLIHIQILETFYRLIVKIISVFWQRHKMADFWYVEPTHTIRNVDTTRITPLILPWIGNFQAKDFALMILGITPHLCMLVTFFFSSSSPYVSLKARTFFFDRVTVDNYDLSTDS